MKLQILSMYYPIFNSIVNTVNAQLDKRGISSKKFKTWQDERINATGLELMIELGENSSFIDALSINFDWDSNHLYKYYYNKYLFINKPKTFESFINNLYNLHIKNLLPWQNNFKTNLDKCLCFSTKLFIHIYPQYLD